MIPVRSTCNCSKVDEDCWQQNRQCTYTRNFKVCSSRHCCNGTTLCITYSECPPVTLVIQIAVSVVMSSSAFPGLPHFSTSSHIGAIFGKKFIEHTIGVFIFLNISHSKKNSARYYTFTEVLMHCIAILVRF